MVLKLHTLISPYFHSIMCFSYEAFQSSLVFLSPEEGHKKLCVRTGNNPPTVHSVSAATQTSNSAWSLSKPSRSSALTLDICPLTHFSRVLETLPASLQSHIDCFRKASLSQEVILFLL